MSFRITLLFWLVRLLIACLIVFAVRGCAVAHGSRLRDNAVTVQHSTVTPFPQRGVVTLASWYAADGFTAASREFPVGSEVLVTDVHNGCRVRCLINDVTSQKHADRIDLSEDAFKQLNGLELGVCEVEVQKL